MALVRCGDCKSEVSHEAATCATCGAPVKAKIDAAIKNGRMCPRCVTYDVFHHRRDVFCRTCLNKFSRNSREGLGLYSLVIWLAILVGLICFLLTKRLVSDQNVGSWLCWGIAAWFPFVILMHNIRRPTWKFKKA
jgi:hypothetical protein